VAGWIKLHRKILDNPIFLKPDLYQLFSYCLLRANHNETKIIWNGKEEILEKGCFITGRKIIAKETKQGESAIYKRLKVLENLNMISLKSNNKFSVVKVLNYSVYQGEEIDKEQPSNNKVTTKEQQSNTDKKVKNDKNVKKDIYGEKVHLSESEYAKLIVQHGEPETKQMISILDNWYLTKGKPPNKSDYHTMVGVGWVLKRFKEDQQKQSGNNDPASKPPSDKYDKFYL